MPTQFSLCDDYLYQKIMKDYYYMHVLSQLREKTQLIYDTLDEPDLMYYYSYPVEYFRYNPENWKVSHDFYHKYLMKSPTIHRNSEVYFSKLKQTTK